MFVLRIAASDLPTAMTLPGALAFAAAVAVPPALALMAARGRFSLFLGAGVSGILLAFGMSALGLLMLPLGITWLVIYVKNRTDGFQHQSADVLTTLGVAFVVVSLAVGAYLVLFLHVDPRCVITYVNGDVLVVPAEDIDMDSGWIWNLEEESSGVESVGPNVVSTSCTSNVVTWPEAVVSLALSSVALAAGAILFPGPELSPDDPHAG